MHPVRTAIRLAAGAAVLAAALPAAPAQAGACVLTLASSGTTRRCSAYAHGYLITVQNGSVSYSVTCNGVLHDSGTVTVLSPRLGSTRQGGCSAVLTMTAQAAGTTAVGYI